MGETLKPRRDKLRQTGSTVAERSRRLNRDPRLLAAVRGLRRILPGDDRVRDLREAAGERQPQVLAKVLGELSTDRPGVIGEAGLGALQLWQAASEAQGRGRGKKELAIAFTDLVDFSDWALEAGDDAAIELLRAVEKAIEPPVGDNGGKVVKRLGDGMMAVFDDVDSALSAILAGRERLSKVEVEGQRPEMRAGIHLGRPRKVHRDYFGVDVNIAARVAECASGGEILVSDRTLEQVERKGLRIREKEVLCAKGVPEDFLVYDVAPAR